MPIILAMNEQNEADLSYDDVPYVSYEFPVRYRNRIVPGEQFIYYRGRRTATGGRQSQVYLGTGIVGEVRPSSSAGRLVSEICDGQPFREPVYFRLPGGAYLESGGSRRGYFQPGVRSIDDETYAMILELGDGDAARASSQAPGQSYASAADARLVEDYSREAASDWLRNNYGCSVTPMSLNNKGFDLRTDSELEYVEVKGTRSSQPTFFITEGERLFSAAHANRYALVLVVGIDLQACTHTDVLCRRGKVEQYTELVPSQWRGRLTR